jgi:hypothetical protein
MFAGMTANGEEEITMSDHRTIVDAAERARRKISSAFIVSYCNRLSLLSCETIFFPSLYVVLGDLIKFSFYYVTKMAKIVTYSMQCTASDRVQFLRQSFLYLVQPRANNLKCERNNKQKTSIGEQKTSQNKEVVSGSALRINYKNSSNNKRKSFCNRATSFRSCRVIFLLKRCQL